MTSTIQAVTSGGGGIASTSDNSGNLSLLAGPNEIVAITAAGANIIGALTISSMSSGTPDTAIITQAQSAIAFTTSGTGNAYTLTPSPAVSAYASGQRFTVTLHTTPALLDTTPVTLNISGLGVKNFKYYNAQGIKVFINSWVTQTNWISDVIYDGTDMVLMNPLHRASGPSTQKAIFGYGSATSITNLVSNTGVVSTDVTGVGTARSSLAAAGYGTDKAIFGYGVTGANVSMTNLVSNTGVVSADTAGVGTGRESLAAAGYGTDKAIFGYGYTTAAVSMTNLVSNTGVVSTDVTGVGTARNSLAAAGYGIDKAIFGYGTTTAVVSMTNLVSNIGVVSTDVTGVGTARQSLAAAGYGTDKAIFGYGTVTGVGLSMTNLVSNTGVVSTDVTGVGTGRYYLAAAGYGTDKAIFGYGYTIVNITFTSLSMTNLVSNTGVVSTDTTGVGTARRAPAAAGFSLT